MTEWLARVIFRHNLAILNIMPIPVLSRNWRTIAAVISAICLPLELAQVVVSGYPRGG